MMLNAQPGSISTAGAVAPSGASQASKGWPTSEPSRDTFGAATATSPISLATAASTKKILAPESAIITPRLSAVDEGANGATATPARRAPKNAATYSIEVEAQMAMTSRGPTPSR